MRILKNNTIGLIIDIQKRLFPVMHQNIEFLENAKMLVSGLQLLNIPLVVTQQYTKGLGDTVDEISMLISDFSYIEKRDFSCCGEPEFMTRLAESNIKNVVICGIESHVCVLQTALDLKESGYVPIIVVDATSSRTAKNLDLALERFRHEGIMMTSTESVLFELTRSSAATEFKNISQLVK